jgi:hypothetical protein
MQFFHQAVKRNGSKKRFATDSLKIAERRTTLDVARDDRGWYKVRAAIDLLRRVRLVAG